MCSACLLMSICSKVQVVRELAVQAVWHMRLWAALLEPVMPKA
jgi:hypothetical protein